MSVTAASSRPSANGTMDTTGWCRDCRAHAHKLCDQADCVCALGAHPKRAGAEPPEDPLADVRARARTAEHDDGLCGYCRAHAHRRCTSATCVCEGHDHPGRATVDPSGQSPVTTATPAKAKLTKPLWELVRADPPAPPPKPRKLTAVDHARPFVEQLMAEGDREWHRFAIFPSSMAAGQTRTRVAKAYREFEFKAVWVPEVSQSAIYGRWTGKRPPVQL